MRKVTEIVWTIAGFDPSSGAGVTADLMVFAAHGLFGCSAITALTVQSTRGVAATEGVRPELLSAMLEELAGDLPAAGIKIGMLGTPEHARVVGGFLEKRRSEPGGSIVPVVLDPVLRSSSGRELYPEAEIEVLHEVLLPHVTCVTPNWGELAALSRRPVVDLQSAKQAAFALLAKHPRLHVVATGGDQVKATDLLVRVDGRVTVLEAERIETRSTHGTGCAFSSALLAQMVLGAELEEAVRAAKAYVRGALEHAPGLGAGKGPMGLLWPLQR